MKIIEPSIKKIDFKTPGKKMEYCGRICYDSTSKINDESYERFIGNIVKSGHYSVIEHERICFLEDSVFSFEDTFKNKKYFTINRIKDKKYISANIRSWYENIDNSSFFYTPLKNKYPFIFTDESIYKEKAGISIVEEIPEEIKKYHDSKTFEIVCSRAASHQIVRHRVFTFSQQSQRYCNYSGDKFDRNINFIMPVFDDIKSFDDEDKAIIINNFTKMFEEAENNYFALIEHNDLRAEDARAILPNATATKLVMTGTTNDWEHFFELRCDKHAQREIRDIACKIREEINA